MMRVTAVYLLLLVSSCDQACCDDLLLEDDTDDDNNDRTFSPAVPPRALTTAPVQEGGGRGRSSSSDSADHLTTSGESHGSRCASYDDNPSSSTRRIELSKRLYSPETQKVADDGIVFHSNVTTLCASFCFTLWVADPRNKSRVTVSKQGCWQIPEGKECLPNYCISDVPPRQNNTHFCCCSGHMCNVRFKDVYNPSEYTSTITQATQVAYGLLPDHSYKNKTIIIALVSVVSVSIATVFLYLGYRLCLATKPSSPQGSLVARLETPEPLLPVFNVDDLKIGDVLVRGRYSEVRRGQLADKEVAVKIYQSHYRQYYYNERNAFTQPFMEHENLVKFYGAKEQEEPQTNVLQYTIVTEYTPLGSLTGYLKNNTVDWYTLCHMCQGVARGLAHLHTDIQKGELFKPAIAHRDVNTRNILVKPDLTCVIVDLGFSVGMIGSRIIKNGVAENAEQATLADVGTLRYMAPEVFDGAVNLRDCEASLKQIDVYALGLVIWEIASRCVDLYQGAPVPEYQLPFQAEAGLHPAFEEMQVLVVKYKTRPKFPEVWKDANPAVRSLKETIEDCWDTDAEARLTSLCVQERIADMSALWIHGNKHRGVTPTLNATINLPEGGSNTANHSSSNTVVSNGVTYIPSFVDRNNEANIETGAPLRDREEASSVVIMDNGRPREYVETCKPNDNIVNAAGPHFSNVHHLCSSSGSFDADDERVRSWLQDQSLSESTVDTILPPTPSLEGNAAGLHGHANLSVTAHATTDPPHVKANNVIIAKHKAVILHPNQGRNPTVERNTHKRSDEELAVSGNILVGPGEHQGGSTSTDRNNRRISLGAPSNRNIDGGGSFDGLETIESSSLVQNDSLGQSHIRPRNTPIPYFQNHVHSESAGVVITSHLTQPKLANINGNKNLYLRLQGEDSNSRLNTSSGQISEKEAKSLKHKLSKLIRPKDLGSKLTHFMFGGIHKKGCAAHVTAGVTDVESAAGRSEGINRTSGQYINSGLDASPVSRGTANITALAPTSLAMEVQIMNGSIVTQAVSDAGNTQAHQNASTIVGPPQGRLSATNVMRLGVLTNPSTEELPSPSLFPKSGSNSSSSIPNCLFAVEPEYALPLQNLVLARSIKDYGSMHPVIINQAYGLESKEEVSSGSDFNTLSTSFKTPDLILTDESHEPGKGLKSPGNERSDPVNASSNNNHHLNTHAELHAALTSDTGGSEKWKHNGPSSFTAPDPTLVYSCNPDVLNHVVQSPQNKSIGSLNSLTLCSSSLHGSAPNTLVNKRIAENLSHNLSHSKTQPTPLNIHHHHHHHHTDTKGGNSIMHYNLADKNSHHKEQQSHHSNLWDKKSAQHQPIKSHPDKSAANTFRQPQTQLNGEKTEGVVASSQSVLRVAQPRNAASLEQHNPQLPTIIAAGKTDSQTGKSRKSRSSPIWQEGSSHENLFSKKRPQSLSLRGHNYNRSKRGRSVSSSSLSSASLHHSAEMNVKPHVKENYENEPLTFAVPNVTLDKSSPLIENSKNMERKPAAVPITSVAVSVTSSACTGTTRSSSSLCDSHVTKGSATIGETVGHVTKNNAPTVGHVTKSNDAIGGTDSHVIKSNAAIGSTIRDSDKFLGNNSAVTDDNTDGNTTTRKHMIFQQQADSSEKIRKRIKTPVSFKKGRLSLYDDRLMTQSLGFVSLSDMDQGSMYGGPGDDNNNGGRGGGEGGMERGRDDYFKLIKSESDLVL